jgi:hypothetical protein
MRPIRSHPSSSKPIAQPNPKPQTLIGGKESEKSPMGVYLLQRQSLFYVLANGEGPMYSISN